MPDTNTPHPPGEDMISSHEEKPQKKKHFEFPSAFTILFILTILAVLATHFVPSGSYSKLIYDGEAQALNITSPDGKESTMPAEQSSLDKLGVEINIDTLTSGAISKPISIPNTYEPAQGDKGGIVDIFTSMVNGTIEAVDIIVFILVLGGLIGVVRASGAFESGLLALTQKTKGREFLLVFATSVFMLIGGSLCGLEEEAAAFYPILVPIFLALGYDSIVCVGAIFLAGSMGTTFSTVNPFSVVIASNAAGIQFIDGLVWRIGGLIVGGIVVISYLYWYSKKVKANQEFSYTYEDHEKFSKLYSMGGGETGPFSWQKK